MAVTNYSPNAKPLDPNQTIYATKIADLPKGPHWVIVVESQYSSRGYDAGDSDYQSYFLEHRVFLTEEAFKAYYLSLTQDNMVGYSKKNFAGYHVDGVAQTKVDVSVQF